MRPTKYLVLLLALISTAWLACASHNEQPVAERSDDHAPIHPAIAASDVVAPLVEEASNARTEELPAIAVLGPDEYLQGQEWVGEMGITESMADILARDAQFADLDVPQKGLSGPKEVPERRYNPLDPRSPQTSQWPPAEEPPGGVPEEDGAEGGSEAPQTIGTIFTGTTAGEDGSIPPDTMAACGPTQIVLVTNGRFKVFTKTGSVTLNTSTLSFFNSVRNGAGVSDPRVWFDTITNRWFVVMINTQIPNRVMLAVSAGSTITSTTNFTFYFFRHDLVGTTPNSDTNGFLDYPSLGVDANAVLVGGNIFNSSLTAFLGTTGHVIRKTSVLSGGPIAVTPFRQMATSTGQGPFAPYGVHNTDAAATESYFIGPDNQLFGRLTLRRIINPGSATPSISGNIAVVVPSTTFPMNVSVLGSTAPLHGIDDRLMSAQMHLNRVNNLRTLWCTHQIEVNSAGTASSTGNRNGQRWYELQNLTTTPSLRQSGTLFSSAATNPPSYWMGSPAMSGQGHMALGCSNAGLAQRAEIAVAGRLNSDALGTIQSPLIAQTSTTNYNAGGNPQRWGDYSMTTVDPADDMTMWTTQEWCNGTNSWGTRIIQLRAPGPATPSSCSPSNVNQGASNVNVVVTGTSSGGTGFYDPPASYPNHISAVVNGGGVTVNSIVWNSPTQITLDVTVAGGATPGGRTITVTNPDGQQATSAAAILTIDAPCPTITITPASLPNGTVGVAYNQALTASGGTGPYTWTLVSGSLPANLSLSAGGVISGTPTAPGTSNFTVRATDANQCPGDKAYALTIDSGCSLSGDMDGNGDVDGDDINCYVACVISGLPSGGCANCNCANINPAAFVAALLAP